MSKLLNVLKFIVLIAGCLGLSFIIIWPLWKFATSLPNVYTFTILTLMSAAFIAYIIRRIIRHAKK